MIFSRESVISILWRFQYYNAVVGIGYNLATAMFGTWYLYSLALTIAIYAFLLTCIYVLEHLRT